MVKLHIVTLATAVLWVFCSVFLGTHDQTLHMLLTVLHVTCSVQHSYEFALKMIGRYLMVTCSRVLIIIPSSNLKIDCYADVDFAFMYGHEKITHHVCIKSRTSYVIIMADCPVLWQSKLKSETALSTM